MFFHTILLIFYRRNYICFADGDFSVKSEDPKALVGYLDSTMLVVFEKKNSANSIELIGRTRICKVEHDLQVTGQDCTKISF